MRRRDKATVGLLSLPVIAFVVCGTATASRLSALVVGWSDEFHRVDWQPLPAPNAPDVTLRHPGQLKLTLGAGTTDVPKSMPFYWASVSRVVDVDADKYPILAVRASHLQGPSWWDVDVQDDPVPAEVSNPFRPQPSPPSQINPSLGFVAESPGLSSHPFGGGMVGTEVKTPSLDHDGVMLFDLQAQQKNGLRLTGDRFRLRLNIAGTVPGGSVEYDWIRFIRREDAARVGTDPCISDLVVEP